MLDHFTNKTNNNTNTQDNNIFCFGNCWLWSQHLGNLAQY